MAAQCQGMLSDQTEVSDQATTPGSLWNLFAEHNADSTPVILFRSRLDKVQEGRKG